MFNDLDMQYSLKLGILESNNFLKFESSIIGTTLITLQICFLKLGDIHLYKNSSSLGNFPIYVEGKNISTISAEILASS